MRLLVFHVVIVEKTGSKVLRAYIERGGGSWHVSLLVFQAE